MRISSWLAGIALLSVASVPAAGDEDDRDRRIEALERIVQELREEVRGLRGERAAVEEDDLEQALREFAERDRDGTGRLSLGGYGEIHLNFGEGAAEDFLDYHRFVLDIGYSFAAGVDLVTELEVEHAAVAPGAGGEIVFEQLHLDVGIGETFGVRFGRFLTPVGLVNQRHEPPAFHGVERPSFDRVVLPTTWSSDGIGVYGSPAPWLSAEAYVVAGLDGSGFSALNGIRGGRITERPSLSDPAFTGRIDLYPFAGGRTEHGQQLRTGLSTWVGGLDNGNRGRNPGVDARLTLLSSDVEYSVGPLDFRAAAAWLGIDGARQIGGGVASAIFGFSLEGAWRVPATDLAIFVRYEDFDTQFRTPAGVSPDPRGDRREVTAGASWLALPNLVIKLDWQRREDGTNENLPDLFNLGVGWQF